jgi:hypothetical protein
MAVTWPAGLVKSRMAIISGEEAEKAAVDTNNRKNRINCIVSLLFTGFSVPLSLGGPYIPEHYLLIFILAIEEI